MHATPRCARVASSICLALLLAACGGDGPTGPGPALDEPGVRAVLGAGITDTVDAQPLQALVVEVRGAGGVVAGSGVVVRFQSQPPADPTRQFEAAVHVCPLDAPTCGLFGAQFATDTTDAHGRAKVTVKLGSVAGRAVVRLTVPELGVEDSATFTVRPGAIAGVLASAADTALDVGATATLRGHVVDRYHNARTEATTVSAGPGSAITLNAATGIVTATDMGTQWVFVRFAAFSDSTSVSVVPGGRLLVWSSNERVVRLVNVNGSEERTIVSGVSSDLGAFPSFDPSRRHITLHAGSQWYGGPPDNVIVIDTTGSPRRDITAATGFNMVITTRQLADGTVLVVGQRSADLSHPGYSLWRVATDNTIDFVVALPGLGSTYGGADISHTGSRIAYISTTSSNPELRVLNVSNGSTILLEGIARSPCWSPQDDRVAFLIPTVGSFDVDGVPVVINADGTGRSALGTARMSAGLAWSPEGNYVVGRSAESIGLRLLRVSDKATVLLRFRSAGLTHDYWQPDWR